MSEESDPKLPTAPSKVIALALTVRACPAPPGPTAPPPPPISPPPPSEPALVELTVEFEGDVPGRAGQRVVAADRNGAIVDLVAGGREIGAGHNGRVEKGLAVDREARKRRRCTDGTVEFGGARDVQIKGAVQRLLEIDDAEVGRQGGRCAQRHRALVKLAAGNMDRIRVDGGRSDDGKYQGLACAADFAFERDVGRGRDTGRDGSLDIEIVRAVDGRFEIDGAAAFQRGVCAEHDGTGVRLTARRHDRRNVADIVVRVEIDRRGRHGEARQRSIRSHVAAERHRAACRADGEIVCAVDGRDEIDAVRASVGERRIGSEHHRTIVGLAAGGRDERNVGRVVERDRAGIGGERGRRHGRVERDAVGCGRQRDVADQVRHRAGDVDRRAACDLHVTRAGVGEARDVADQVAAIADVGAAGGRTGERRVGVRCAAGDRLRPMHRSNPSH